MLQIKNNYNIMRFKNDDDFYDFCVQPAIVIRESQCDECSNGIKPCYQDFLFTDRYVNAVNNGIHFIIEDENSQIYKRGTVSYKSITKNVHNLMPYYGE